MPSWQDLFSRLPAKAAAILKMCLVGQPPAQRWVDAPMILSSLPNQLACQKGAILSHRASAVRSSQTVEAQGA